MRVKELSLVYRTVPGAATFARRLCTPREAAAFLTPLLAYEASEVFGVVPLSTKFDILGWHVVSRGTLNATAVSPREVFIPALLANAYGLILAHNHPSGDPTPSPEDVELTRRMVSAASLIGLTVADHLVICEGSYYSFKEQGCI